MHTRMVKGIAIFGVLQMVVSVPAYAGQGLEDVARKKVGQSLRAMGGGAVQFHGVSKVCKSTGSPEDFGKRDGNTGGTQAGLLQLPDGLSSLIANVRSNVQTLLSPAYCEGLLSGGPKTREEALDQLYQDYPRSDVDTVVSDLGVTADRLTPTQLKEVVKNRLNPASDNRPIAIVMVLGDDHNGAFTTNYGPIANNTSQLVGTLMDHGYRVMVYDVQDDQDLLKAMKKGSLDYADPASAICFIGHGNQSASGYDQDTNHPILDSSSCQMLKNAGAQDALKKGGTVLFLSCSVGEGDVGTDNLVNEVYALFPEARHVLGPTIPVMGVTPQFSSSHEIIGATYQSNFLPIPGYDAPSGTFKDTPVLTLASELNVLREML